MKPTTHFPQPPAPSFAGLTPAMLPDALLRDSPGGLDPAEESSGTPKLGAHETPTSAAENFPFSAELLDAAARDNAQIAADFIWAGNRKAAREHLKLAGRQLEQADAQAGSIVI